jgi:hypothetical protein
MASLTNHLSAMHAVAEAYHKSRNEQGAAHYAVCLVCAHVQWECSESKAPPAIHVRPMHESGRECPDCTEISRRHPELAAWLAPRPEPRHRGVRRQDAGGCVSEGARVWLACAGIGLYAADRMVGISPWLGLCALAMITPLYWAAMNGRR